MTRRTWARYLITMGALTVVLLTTALAPAAIQHAQASAAQRYRENEVVVKIDAASGATIDQINATYGTRTLQQLDPGTNTYLLQTAPGQDAELVAEQMAVDLRLLFAEPNFIGYTPEADPSNIKGWGGANAAPLTSQYAISMLGLAQAQSLSRGNGTLVAVIDTGVQLDHPALAARLVAGYDFLDNDAVPADEFNNRDDDGDGAIDEGAGHGTHVAGIIHLVAPDARIMPLRALDSDGTGDEFSVAEAIDYATQHGVNVINLSLGSPDRSDLSRDVIRRATRRGVVVVVASGNLNTSAEQYPAADQCALGVTSVGSTDRKSSFASFGEWVDIAAPGESIYSTFPPSGYAWWSGTSMATPFVAGQAALIHSMAPTANVRNMAMLMSTTARSLTSLNPGFSGQLGAGRVNIGASLQYLATKGFPHSGPSIISGGCIS